MPCLKLKIHLLGRYDYQFGYSDLVKKPVVWFIYPPSDNNISEYEESKDYIIYDSISELFEEWTID